MIGLVLVGHGVLAPAALRSVESVLGHPVPGMLAVSASTDDTLESLKERIAGAVREVEQGQGTLILTDMFGDSATNVSIALAHEAHIQVVTGVNLPVLLKVVSARHAMDLDTLATFIVEYGRAHMLRAGQGARGTPEPGPGKHERR
jgi:PTS system mannose-specific IIA component